MFICFFIEIFIVIVKGAFPVTITHEEKKLFMEVMVALFNLM